MIPGCCQCASCKHMHFDGKAMTGECDAFKFIPNVMIGLDHDHRQPYPGDNGIRWEPKSPGEKHPLEPTPP